MPIFRQHLPKYGIEKAHLFRPNEWNKTRKKDVTHNQTVAFLGELDKWHYEKRVKSEKSMEHILDAAATTIKNHTISLSMNLYQIQKRREYGTKERE